MALMTSSSVTSSAVPAKLVSRRSIRMARSLSALPRNAPISCRRSVSLRGRKSIDVLLPEKRTTTACVPLGLARRSAGKAHSTLCRQLGQQEIDATVDAFIEAVGLQEIAAAEQEVVDLLLRKSDTQGVARFGQGDVNDQPGPMLARHDFKRHA